MTIPDEVFHRILEAAETIVETHKLNVLAGRVDTPMAIAAGRAAFIVAELKTAALAR